MRYIRHFLCVACELHRDLRSYMGWEVHRGSGGEFLCEVWAWRPRRPWRARGRPGGWGLPFFYETSCR